MIIPLIESIIDRIDCISFGQAEIGDASRSLFLISCLGKFDLGTLGMDIPAQFVWWVNYFISKSTYDVVHTR